MKKIIMGLVVILVILFAFEYQKPVMTSLEAEKKTIECIKHPPEEWQITPVDVSLDDLKSFYMIIKAKEGFFNQLTNQREMSVTADLKGKNPMTPMVQLDAYTGKCLRIIGPME
ncbi:hypothetical protein [Falsibacillus pallidus]|uniref:Uncharacterized protein n=1 Tax=Falsibacillus pallidus TaxID=493781 RepID=A0A370G9J0_9BACI|nr:hypothetical protein [Falsibacillus pallidus]RDI39124.1 hypothetical protein DFR59_11531 [Falsibacillus pallidus]